MLPRLIAEGMVIIVGVLVALAVDRAATRVDERSLEQQYLDGLATDLRAVADALRQASSAAERSDQAARVVLAAARGDVQAASSGLDLARALVLAGFIIEPQLVRDTRDDVVDTGRLYVLRDAELRRRLGSR